jgi:hypothetical protein
MEHAAPATRQLGRSGKLRLNSGREGERMRRLLSTGALVLSIACVGNAQAGWKEFWHRTKVDFHRNNAWPEPFQQADRAAAREPFAIMVNNGWRMQNTLGTYLFDDTQQLNRAGEIKLRWILTQAPHHRRAVFVLQGHTPQETAVRVESVQQAISRMVPAGPLPPVMLTDTEPEGGSGEYYDAVNRALQSSLPSPRLPASSASSAGEVGSEGQ